MPQNRERLAIRRSHCPGEIVAKQNLSDVNSDDSLLAAL